MNHESSHNKSAAEAPNDEGLLGHACAKRLGLLADGRLAAGELLAPVAPELKKLELKLAEQVLAKYGEGLKPVSDSSTEEE